MLKCSFMIFVSLVLACVVVAIPLVVAALLAGWLAPLVGIDVEILKCAFSVLAVLIMLSVGIAALVGDQ